MWRWESLERLIVTKPKRNEALGPIISFLFPPKSRMLVLDGCKVSLEEFLLFMVHVLVTCPHEKKSFDLLQLLFRASRLDELALLPLLHPFKQT